MGFSRLYPESFYGLAEKCGHDRVVVVINNLDIVAPAIDHAGLKPREKEVLRHIAQRRRAQGKDFAQFGFKQYQGLFNHLASLAAKRLLVKERSGRDVVYIPRGDVVLYFEADPMGAWF